MPELHAAPAAWARLQRRAGGVVLAPAPVAAGAPLRSTFGAVARAVAALADHEEERRADPAAPREGLLEREVARHAAVEPHQLPSGVRRGGDCGGRSSGSVMTGRSDGGTVVTLIGAMAEVPSACQDTRFWLVDHIKPCHNLWPTWMAGQPRRLSGRRPGTAGARTARARTGSRRSGRSRFTAG